MNASGCSGGAPRRAQEVGGASRRDKEKPKKSVSAGNVCMRWLQPDPCRGTLESNNSDSDPIGHKASVPVSNSEGGSWREL